MMGRYIHPPLQKGERGGFKKTPAFRQAGVFWFFGLLVSLFFGSINCFAQEWQELKGDHFLVYFTKDEGFAKDVLSKSELYYNRISSDLGYARYSEFWSWDKRVKIYIYPDKDSFLKASGEQNWSEGMADYKKKEIVSYAWNQGFLESLLPHELAHLIFRDFVGFKGEVPLWLDEGVAQWAEEAKRRDYKAMSKYYLKKETLLALDVMMTLDIRQVKENDKIHMRLIHSKDGQEGVLFLGGEELVNVYYLQAVSIVGFLIEKYGSDNFAVFCRQLRDGKSLEESFRFAYPLYIQSLKELEERWVTYLEES